MIKENCLLMIVEICRLAVSSGGGLGGPRGGWGRGIALESWVCSGIGVL